MTTTSLRTHHVGQGILAFVHRRLGQSVNDTRIAGGFWQVHRVDGGWIDLSRLLQDQQFWTADKARRSA